MRAGAIALAGLLCLALAGCATPGPSGGDAPGCPTLGAIRWDAWFGDSGVPGRAVERSLGPSRWHHRLPECATVRDDGRVVIACDSPQQMAREIDQAADAGLGFWAFVTYAESDPMSRGLQTYLAASNRQRIRFALLTELSQWGDRASYRPVLQRFAQLMREETYLRTPEGRPVLFLGFVSDAEIQRRFGSLEGLAQVIAEFRALVMAAGASRPFIVLLSPEPARAQGWSQALATDAVGAYVVADNTAVAAPYAALAAHASAYWAAIRDRGLPLVPTVMSGWDRRPRVQNPVPWERGTPSEQQMSWYYEPPTRDELQQHALAALTLARADARAGGLALAYAWNEFDEGGWLAPTRGSGAERLQAIRDAVNRACERPGPAGR